MPSHADFHALMLAEPHLTLHARSYGAYLHLLHHPQASAWRLHCALRCAAEAGDLDTTRGPPAKLGPLLERFRGHCQPRLQAACLLARYLPLGDGRSVSDLFPDDGCAQALVLGELHAHGLADDSQTGASFLWGAAALAQDRCRPGAAVGSRAAARAARHAVLAGNPRDGQDHLRHALGCALDAVAEAAAHQPQVADVEEAVQAARAWAAECIACVLPRRRAPRA